MQPGAGVCASQAQNTERKPQGKASGGFCPNLTNPYYVMLLQGIEARATEQGFGLFVCNTQRDLELEERYLKDASSLNPQGSSTPVIRAMLYGDSGAVVQQDSFCCHQQSE